MKSNRHLTRIALREFNERLRSGWIVACFTVWLGAIALTSFFGLAQVGRLGLQGYERTVVSLLNLVQYLVPLLGLLIGHDLLVGEREDRTLGLALATGVLRPKLVLGKFIGGCMTLAVPLLLGFLLSGAAIGVTTRDHGWTPFLLLAGSGLVLGVVFLGIGLAISTLSRTRVQALVLSLLAWCIAVFAFDLVALGMVLTSEAPAAAHEIEVACDATHVNSLADLHSAYDAPAGNTPPPAATSSSSSFSWLMLDPVDAFRSVNLARAMSLPLPVGPAALSCLVWIVGAIGVSLGRFQRLDL